MTRIIKRYDNRKLYDTQTSKTVTLSEIAEMIRQEDDVQVVDSANKDITHKVLAQIFLQENLETKQMFLNKFLLQGLIQESENVEQVIKKFLLGGIGLASLTRDRLEELVNELVKRGQIAEDERAKFVKDLMDKGSKEFHKVVDKVSSSLQPSENNPSKEEKIQALERQIQELHEELDGLIQHNEKKAKAPAKKKPKNKVSTS